MCVLSLNLHSHTLGTERDDEEAHVLGVGWVELARTHAHTQSWNKHKLTVAALLAGSNNCFSAGTNYRSTSSSRTHSFFEQHQHQHRRYRWCCSRVLSSLGAAGLPLLLCVCSDLQRDQIGRPLASTEKQLRVGALRYSLAAAAYRSCRRHRARTSRFPSSHTSPWI